MVKGDLGLAVHVGLHLCGREQCEHLSGVDVAVRTVMDIGNKPEIRTAKFEVLGRDS
jgi:hypothetical protein